MKNIALALALALTFTPVAFAGTKPADCEKKWSVREVTELASWRKKDAAEMVSWKAYRAIERNALLDFRSKNKDAYLTWLDATEIEDFDAIAKVEQSSSELELYLKKKDEAHGILDEANATTQKTYEAELLAARHTYEDAELACQK